MLILGIDTSGKTAAAALFEDGIMLGQTCIYTVRTQSQVILPTVKRLMSDCSREFSQLTGIAVSNGPGSYTGIRIGISAVKAMSFALDIPCFEVSSLEGLAFTCGFEGIVCPIIKARKDLVYSAVYRIKDGVSEELFKEQVIAVEGLKEKMSGYNEKIMLTGDGAEEFIKETDGMDVSLSPIHLRYQSGTGIILASLNKPPRLPEEINASYLQLVKAEKDLINNNLKK